MAVVNTNECSSLKTPVRNERSMNAAMEKLSTGQRINSAGDDAWTRDLIAHDVADSRP